MVTEFTEVLSTKAFLKKKKFFGMQRRFENYTYLKTEGSLKTDTLGAVFLWQTQQHRLSPEDKILAAMPSFRGAAVYRPL